MFVEDCFEELLVKFMDDIPEEFVEDFDVMKDTIGFESIADVVDLGTSRVEVAGLWRVVVLSATIQLDRPSKRSVTFKADMMKLQIL